MWPLTIQNGTLPSTMCIKKYKSNSIHFLPRVTNHQTFTPLVMLGLISAVCTHRRHDQLYFTHVLSGLDLGEVYLQVNACR